MTIHEAPITQDGWTGAGLTIIDPNTGAGGYLIEGGSNGGSTPSTLTDRVMTILGLGGPYVAAKDAVGVAINSISFAVTWLQGFTECYASEITTVFTVIAIALFVAFFIIGSSGPGGLFAPGLVAALISMLGVNAYAASEPKECQISCPKANTFHFANAKPEPIINVEAFKVSYGFTPTSRY